MLSAACGILALGSFPVLGADAGAARGLTPESIPFDRVGATELPALKAVLERAGWPAAHVQALLNAEIQRRLNPEPVLKREDLKPFFFWRTGPDALPLAHLDTPVSREERAGREEAARLAYDRLFPQPETAGSDLLLHWEEERRWGTLPGEKRLAVKGILERAEKARDKFMDERGRMLTAGEREELWRASRDTRRQLEEALGPEALLDYDLRNSDTAARMRKELDAFEPSREEFVAIFQLRHPLELEFENDYRGPESVVAAKREAAEKEIGEKIEALLGPERFGDYQISLQPECQLLRFDGRYAKIDAAAVRRLYRVLLEARSRIEKADSLPEAERTHVREGIKQGLFREFRALLDEEGTRRYLGEQGLWP